MSLAPDRLAIGIRRHFTTPGVHPYDEVVWERRDARISNWKDGTVAFEQLDVEFPTTWSLNATNIVAQKYFRGKLGSPERENSVKQMIGRVAGTISNWGREGGYFASEEDADAFEMAQPVPWKRMSFTMRLSTALMYSLVAVISHDMISTPNSPSTGRSNRAPPATPRSTLRASRSRTSTRSAPGAGARARCWDSASCSRWPGRSGCWCPRFSSRCSCRRRSPGSTTSA